MADVPHRQSGQQGERGSALDRIDRAIARIEAATMARTENHAALVRRHDALRTRIGEAVTALDSILAQAPPSEGDA